MAIISEGTVLQTRHGYVHIEDYDNDVPVLTENGFQQIKVEPINYTGQFVRLILWGFPDVINIASDTKALGTTYERCKDLGGLGICRPHNRCWEECPSNHPNKLHFQNPQLLSFREIRKRSHVISPTGDMNYSHKDKNKAIKKFYDSGFKFSRDYKLNPEEIPVIDLEYILFSNPEEFKSFVLGWQDGMGQTKLDMWNYFLILKNKTLAYQVQFLFNYFGVPCALEPYHSNTHGGGNWAVIWCKNKKAFHYKSFKYENKMYTQVKKWTPFTTSSNEETSRLKWFNISKGTNNDSKYFCAPFYFGF